MPNVSQYLQAPGTDTLDVHEKSLSKSDLKETFKEENERSSAFAMMATLGIGVGIGDFYPSLLINGPQWSARETAVRLGIGVVSLVAAFALKKFARVHGGHANRAFELLTGEIGERPVKNSAVPANNL